MHSAMLRALLRSHPLQFWISMPHCLSQVGPVYAVKVGNLLFNEKKRVSCGKLHFGLKQPCLNELPTLRTFEHSLRPQMFRAHDSTGSRFAKGWLLCEMHIRAIQPTQSLQRARGRSYFIVK